MIALVELHALGLLSLRSPSQGGANRPNLPPSVRGVSPGWRSCRCRFSLYDLGVVSDEQIQKWTEEADAGYDVAELKRRGRGRPGRGAEPAQVVAVRLTAEELEALDAAAQRHDLSRSEAIRAALAHFAA